MGLVNCVTIAPPNARQGDFRARIVHVWQCYEDCQCSQVFVVRRYRHALCTSAIWDVTVWEGALYTDGEGAALEAHERAQALHDVRLRYPLELWPPATPHRLTLPHGAQDIDHTDDEALRDIARHEFGTLFLEGPFANTRRIIPIGVSLWRVSRSLTTTMLRDQKTHVLPHEAQTIPFHVYRLEEHTTHGLVMRYQGEQP